eukprot:239210_1
MENGLLSCLIFIIILQFPLPFNDVYLNVIISFLIIFPFILLIYYIYKFIRVKSEELYLLSFRNRVKFLFLCVVWYYYVSPNENNREHTVTSDSNIEEKDTIQMIQMHHVRHQNYNQKKATHANRSLSLSYH